jgi:hypothetical protein
MDGQKRQTLNHLLTALPPGLLVDSAWLQAQGVARTSVHDYVRRGWLERVAPASIGARPRKVPQHCCDGTWP